VSRPLTLTTELGEWTVVVNVDQVSVSPDGETFLVREIGNGRWSASLANVATGQPATATAVISGDAIWVGIDGHAIEFHVQREAQGVHSPTADQDALSTPMAATVVRVNVRAGDHVEAGDTLIVLEAMKMELPIRAPRAGTIRAVRCSEGQLVQPHDTIIEMGQ
jgi:3-methylcrotonyl-CoA carboxylase alpha subunit